MESESVTEIETQDIHADEYEPFFFGRLLVNYTKSVFCAVFGFMIVIMVTLVANNEFRLWDNSDRDFAVRTHSIVKQRWALELAEEYVQNGEGEGVTQATRSIDLMDRRLIVMYQSEMSPRNLVNKQDFDLMRSIEDFIQADPLYGTQCFAGTSFPNCSSDAYLSFLRQVPSTYDTAQIQAAAKQASQYIGTGTQAGNALEVYFDKDFANQSTTSGYMRSVFRFGGPLKGYKNTKDREDEQRDIFLEMIGRIDEKVQSSATDRVTPLYFGQDALYYVFRRTVLEDLQWATGAMMFVFAYMWIHTRSLFMASMGIFQILLAFPFGFFIYKKILGIAIFQTLHVMSVFIMLGIGADDIFVFVDAWKQAGAYEVLQNDLELRMCYAYRRAARAMLVTSFTTIAAFLATSISPIIPISAFGFWAACLIFANYLLVVTFFPCVILMWHRWFDGLSWKDVCLCKCFKRCLNKEESTTPATGPIPMSPLTSSQKTLADPGPRAAATFTEPAVDHGSDETKGVDVSKLRTVERMFHGPWMKRIHKYKWITLTFFGIFLVTTVYYATTIGPLTEEEQFFPDGHYITKAFEANKNQFRKGEFDRGLRVYMLYGVSGVDQSSMDQWNPQDVGRVVWDNSFDLSPLAAQQYLLDTCTALRTSDLVLKNLVTCFIEEYRDWRIQTTGQNSSFPANFSSDPVVQRQNFTSSLLDYIAYMKQTKAVDRVSDNSIGIDPSGRLRFVTVQAISTLAPFLSYSVTKPVYDQWQEFITARNSNPQAPPTLNNGMQTALEYWGRMITEREFVNNAVRGMGIAMAVAYAVLVASTLNWLIAMYACFSIIGIVGAVGSMMVIQGWNLGVSESVALVLLVGFSVDYVVHVCNSYVESLSRGRFSKTRDALVQMGISIIAGAVTSGGAALFLLPTTIIFFRKFAIIMSSTIFWALIYSLVFFPSLLDAFGPQGDTGDLKPLLLAVRRKLCKSSDDDADDAPTVKKVELV